MNKTFAVFANGGTMTTAQTALWQYDYGQILVVQGIELPTAYEVQFCNAGDSTTITSVGDSTGVVIPDQFLQNGETIYAYIYLHTGNSDGETEYKITIPVMDRAEPTDIEPTPQQESTIGQLIDALNSGVEAAEEAAEKGPQIIDGYWYIWDADAGEFVNTNVKAEGEDGTNGTNGSNVWTIAVENTTTSGNTIRVKTANLIGPSTARPAYGDLVVVSDGRFGTISVLGSTVSSVPKIGDLHGDPGVGVPPSGSTGQVLKKASGADYDTVWADESGGGTSDYSDLTNKPQINSVTLSGNKSLSDFGAEPEALTVTVSYSDLQLRYVADATYSEISSAITAKKRIKVFRSNANKYYDLFAVKSSSIEFASVGDGENELLSVNSSNLWARTTKTVGSYSKPSGGIPAGDLAAAVQTSLGKADAAIPAPASPSSAQDLVYLNGAWVAADKLYIVNCTPTALDYSGTMDKTVAQIYAAYQAGKSLVFRLWTAADSYFDTVGTMFWTTDDYTYPSFNAFAVLDSPYDSIVCAFTGATNDGTKATYFTSVYPLSTSACIPAPSSPSSGDVLTYGGAAWVASAPHYVPAGGNSGAVLAKSSGSDYALTWRAISDYTAAGIIVTAGATAAKTCQYSLWDDTHYPQILYITLALANTAASALTMKVNGKGPYPIYINGAASSSTNYTLPAGSYVVVFDGTNFYFDTTGKMPSSAFEPKEVTNTSTGDVTLALDPGKIYHFTGSISSLTLTLTAAATGQIAQYHFDFNSGSTAATVSIAGVTWQGSSFTPEASKHYEVDILNGYGVVCEW